MTITGSVGERGVNRKEDVMAVQKLLTAAGRYSGSASGVCDATLIKAIRGFQATFATHPDGRIDPGGTTLKRLVELAPPPPPYAGPGAAADWSGDSSQWTREKKLQSLEPGFRVKVEAVLAALKASSFEPRIVFGWRSVAVQQKLKAEKKSTLSFSFHCSQHKDGTPNSWAADIIDKRWAYGKDAEANGFWAALGAAAKAEGLVWGGDWKSFPDVSHIQGRANSELAAVRAESGL
ncbi:MAG: peptidoglycan-binding protein [Bryobacterales bacterium]|nr:peptidoglycan-binding protein [Bryobacterales bacterium]